MLSLISAGHFHPEITIDNPFLESLDIGTSQEWIEERVGILSRRTVLPLDYIRTTRNRNPLAAKEAALYNVTDMGVFAAQMALKRAKISAQQIGLVIAGVSVPQMSIPAHACLISAKLGINAPAFDLNSACSTFVAQLHFLQSMRPEALPDFILLIQSETYTMATDYNDRNTAVLWGDGAAAVILSPRHRGKAQIISSVFDSNPAEHDKVAIPSSGHFSQAGSQVQRFAILQTELVFKELQKKIDSNSSINYFIGHQANLRMLESVSHRIKIEKENHYYNVDLFGNCGGAGAPSVLSQKWDTFHSTDFLALVTVGSGLSWGGLILEF